VCLRRRGGTVHCVNKPLGNQTTMHGSGSSEREFAQATDRVRRVVSRLAPAGGMHNVRIRAPDSRKYAMRVTVENLEGVNVNDLVESLSPARVFIRSSSDVGSKIDIYFQNNLRKDLVAIEIAAWCMSFACSLCFMKIALA